MRKRLNHYEESFEKRRRIMQEVERCKAKLRLMEKKLVDHIKSMEG